MRQLLLLILMHSGVSGYCQSLPQFHAQLDQFSGITYENEKRMKDAIIVFEKVMNDTNFQKELLETKFSFDVPNDVNKILARGQLIQKIFSAEEFYKKGIDNTANIHWIIVKKRRPYFTRYPAIGEGEEDGIEIYTYTWFFESADMDEIVGHIAHEWSHKVGFEHAFEPHPGRENTVPYAFGYLVEKYAKVYVEH